MITLKYILAALLLFAILMAPAWFVSQTKKDKLDHGIVRSTSWLLGWTCVGWFFALWWARSLMLIFLRKYSQINLY